MGLSKDEIKAAVKMYQFVRQHEASQRMHPLLKWGGPLGLGLTALLQIHENKLYGYFFGAAVFALVFSQCVLSLERARRYAEAVVLIQVLERDHPEEFEAIRQYQAEEEKKGLFLPNELGSRTRKEARRSLESDNVG